MFAVTVRVHDDDLQPIPIFSVMILDDIARDEELDALNPLRHLMDQHEDISDASKPLSVLPRQSHSIQNEIHELSFVNDRDTSQPPITITLSVDASPGCGGIAWPAGQVRASNSANRIFIYIHLSRSCPTTSLIKAQNTSKVGLYSN